MTSPSPADPTAGTTTVPARVRFLPTVEVPRHGDHRERQADSNERPTDPGDDPSCPERQHGHCEKEETGGSEAGTEEITEGYRRQVRACMMGGTVVAVVLVLVAPVAFLALVAHHLPSLAAWLIILIAAQIPGYAYFLQGVLLHRLDSRVFAAGGADE